MVKDSRKTNQWLNTGKQLVIACVILAAIITLAVVLFRVFFKSYQSDVLYAERLNQMQEVTEQLFSGLDDVVDVQWDNARYQCNYLNMHIPTTVDGLLELMQQQSSLTELESKQSVLIAVDDQGRYYYPSGKQGMLSSMNLINNRPDQISYVFNNVTSSRSEMLFLIRLTQPITVQNSGLPSNIIYYGLAVDMEQLDPYFNCKAYGNSSSTYVVDENGLKLFGGGGNSLQLEGFNVFSSLRSMQYQHNLSFNEALQILNQNDLAYSNAVMDGEEYYYALYRMKNAEWILVFLVPSRYVATNTVELVNTTMSMLMIFAVVMGVVCASVIYAILRIQQRRALRLANETNALLEVNNHALEQAQTATNQALQAAKAASRAKTDFLTNISHDIRTPMNAIVGITKLMAHEKSDPEKIDSYIGKIQKSSQHLLSLINDVLDMSKIESGDVKLSHEPINIGDQIWQVDSIMRPQIEEAGQSFKILVRNVTHEHLIGDAVRLRQVFINLLSNATKYTPYGGHIRLELEEIPSATPNAAVFRIVVTDDGYGMTPEFMQHIFEPFTRAENSVTNRVQGTGLGMAIIRNIVDMKGGTITVRSEVNKGSCFTVELPFRIDTESKTELPIRSALLITDDADLIGNTEAAFRSTDASLSVAQTEAEVDQVLQTQKPDIILLGTRLGGQKVTDHLARLREKTGNIPLLLFCEYEERQHLAGIVGQGGVDGVVALPFFLTDLALVIERILVDGATTSAGSTSVLKGMHFLCAEDNGLNAEVLAAILDMKGASCLIYPDGKKLVDAFASVKPGEFDAILMDVQMPLMNGLDATQAIRLGANPLGKTIPIIAMTANAFSEDVQNCLDAGMDAHISKPLDIAALERTVKSLTNGNNSGGGRTPPLKERQ